ncbi:hypothetical protein D3C77_396770 [compost metagenome]
MRHGIKSQWINMTALQHISTFYEACELGRMTMGEDLLLITTDVKPSAILTPHISYKSEQHHNFE